jgi:hypothetical protein
MARSVVGLCASILLLPIALTIFAWFLLFPLPAGYSVAALGLLAVIMASLGSKEPSRRERAFWIAGAFLLMILEIVAIQHEHNEQTKTFQGIIKQADTNAEKERQYFAQQRDLEQAHFERMTQIFSDKQSADKQLVEARIEAQGQETLKARALLLATNIFNFLGERERGQPSMPVVFGPERDEVMKHFFEESSKYGQGTVAGYDQQFASRAADILTQFGQRGVDIKYAQLICGGVNNFFAVRACAMEIEGAAEKLH